MDIFATVNLSLFHNLKEANDKLILLANLGIKGLRFNIKRLNVENLKKFCEIINNLNESSILENFDLYLDLPYPREKYRILDIIKNNDSNIYYITDSACLSQNNIIMPSQFFEGNQFVKNHIIYYADGQNAFLVQDVLENNILKAEVIGENNIMINKSLHSIILANSILNKKLKRVLTDITTKGVGIFLSFVRNERDVIEFKQIMNTDTIYSKIEDTIGVANVENIAAASDGLIIARGDLSLNVKLSELYSSHLKIVAAGKKYCKKIFVATNILSSLTNRCYPTTSDILDLNLISSFKVDGIILSATQLYDNFPNTIKFIKKTFENNSGT